MLSQFFDLIALSANRIAFAGETQGNVINTNKRSHHSSGCGCPGCYNIRRGIFLFSNVVEGTEVPPEVMAMDGIESSGEAHNIDRPARQQIKKKKPAAGKSLSEFEEGSTVTGIVKSLASYGAFVDIGATTDGLLHVSQLSTEFVSDVSNIVKEGQKVDVRIVKIDTDKGQIGLSMMTAEQESEANEAAKKSRKSRGISRQRNRRDDSAVLGVLQEKGWDTALMVEGTVVSTTNFGAFVKVDASKLNSEVEGVFDGLVHISVLRIGRVGSVEDVVSPNDKVQVRCKSIDDNKVSLTMLSVEDEETKNSGRGGDNGGFGSQYMEDMGAKDWQESCDSIEDDQASFSCAPLVNSAP